MIMAWRHQSMNATFLQLHLCPATGITISTQTVWNCLHAVGLYARQPVVCVRLTAIHRWAFREWATEHVHWRRNGWSDILYSNESWFSFHPDNRRIFIWSECCIQNNPAFAHESFRFDVGGGMVYAGISIDRCTDLHIIQNGVLTGRRYKDEILRPIVVPYAAAIRDDFILIDGNCKPHCVHILNDFLLEEGIIWISDGQVMEIFWGMRWVASKNFEVAQWSASKMRYLHSWGHRSLSAEVFQ